MTISEEQDMAKRWDQLKQAGPSTNVQRTSPVMGNKEKVSGKDQSTIPGFFDFDEPERIPQFVEPSEWLNAVSQAAPVPMSLPQVNINPISRRINPIPINPQKEVQKTNKGTVRTAEKGGYSGITGGKSGAAIDLQTETTATSRNTPHPTFGSTTMETTEEQRIHTIVCRVMEEKYGQGRAALRQHLGLATEDPKISKNSVAP